MVSKYTWRPEFTSVQFILLLFFLTAWCCAWLVEAIQLFGPQNSEKKIFFFVLATSQLSLLLTLLETSKFVISLFSSNYWSVYIINFSYSNWLSSEVFRDTLAKVLCSLLYVYFSYNSPEKLTWNCHNLFIIVSMFPATMSST